MNLIDREKKKNELKETIKNSDYYDEIIRTLCINNVNRNNKNIIHVDYNINDIENNEKLLKFLIDKLEINYDEQRKANIISIENLYGVDDEFLVSRKIVSILFEKYRELISNETNEIHFDIQKKILEKFEKTMKSIRYNTLSLNKILETNSDDIDILTDLADTYSLRKSFEDLISEFIAVLYRCNRKKNCFVVVINNVPKSELIYNDIYCNLSLENLYIIINEETN